MPRKLRRPKERRPDPAPLDPRVVHVLLHGWVDLPAPAIDADPFAVFGEDLEQVWLRHRTTLMDRWRICGDEVWPWAAQRFDHQPGSWNAPYDPAALDAALGIEPTAPGVDLDDETRVTIN